MDNQDRSLPGKRPHITLGGQRYALLRQFTEGMHSVVWQAQPLPQASRPDETQYERVELAGFSLLEYLRRESQERFAPDASLGAELVAIKLPLAGGAMDVLRQEARNLSRLRGISERSQRLVALQHDLSEDSGCPCLVLAWASGQQLDRLAAPMAEPDGLAAGFQVAEVIEVIFNRRYTPLTDSIKPNSIFWDADTRQVTIIDLGVEGETMASLEKMTLPLLGDTMHWILVGEHVGNAQEGVFELDREDKIKIGKAGAWQGLSYGARAIIRKLLLGEFLPYPTEGLDREPLFQCLKAATGAVRGALKTQMDLWGEPLDSLLSRARRAGGVEAMNLYDVARLRQAALSEQDEQNYQEHLHALIWEKLRAGEHVPACMELRWAHRRYPEHGLARRAWLANQAARDLPALENVWPGLMEVLEVMEQGDALFERRRL